MAVPILALPDDYITVSLPSYLPTQVMSERLEQICTQARIDRKKVCLVLNRYNVQRGHLKDYDTGKVVVPNYFAIPEATMLPHMTVFVDSKGVHVVKDRDRVR